ncbi:MAG: permease [Candidatus Thorarchaeota archaeon]|nr:permease [Candidatus Thorarchaeota archaeon]
MQNILYTILFSGFESLLDYLQAHVLLCLVPAFFISGAFSALIPKSTITKYMGSSTSRMHLAVAYIFAATSGLILEVCSCTILPLFAGIWKKGAGFGPAITFLFAGPGITLLSTPLTAAVIGPEFALIKLLISIVVAIAIGMSMELIFEDKRSSSSSDFMIPDETTEEVQKERSTYQSAAFFISLTMVMVFGTAPIDLLSKIILVSAATIITAIIALMFYSRSELGYWMTETRRFIRMLFPILLVGVFISGLIRPLVPAELVVALAGTNSLAGNAFAVLFGTIAYFPTLVEVPIADMFLQLGMHPGPLMAYLVSDPAVSIQTLLVVNKIMKPARTIAYGLLLMAFSIAAGFLYGMWF